MSEEEKTISGEMGTKEHEALFKGFVSLITGMTMQQLGKITSPLTGKVERNLDVARAWIETLKMIEVKTKGNLNDEERRFLDTSIANLQMNYVDEIKKGPEKTGKEPGKKEEEPAAEKAESQTKEDKTEKTGKEEKKKE